LANQIEEDLYRKCKGINRQYKTQCRGLVFNLTDDSNPDLQKNVLNGKISPDKLTSMSPFDLASDDRKRKREKLIEEYYEENVEIPKMEEEQLEKQRYIAGMWMNKEEELNYDIDV